MISFGPGMIFPDSYDRDQPEGPPDVSCPVCTEDMLAGETCPHCGYRGFEGFKEQRRAA